MRQYGKQGGEIFLCGQAAAGQGYDQSAAYGSCQTA